MSFLAKRKATNFKTKSYLDSLQEYILNNLSSERESKERERIYSYDGFCSRKSVIEAYTLYTNSISPESKFFMEVGTCYESILVNLLEKNNILVANSIYLPKYENDPKVNYTGIIDLIIKDFNNELVLIDIKTTGRIKKENSIIISEEDLKNKTFDPEKVIARPGLSDKINPVYEYQVQLYSLITGIDTACLFYISRAIVESFNGGLACEIQMVDTSEPKLLKVAQNLCFSHLCIEAKILPAKNENFKKTVHCKYCNFQDFCYKDNQIDLTDTILQDPDIEKELRKQADEMGNKLFNNRQARKEQFLEILQM